MNIVLTGTPGSGKSKIGKVVAKKFALKYINLNEIVVKKKLWSREEEGVKVVRLQSLKNFLNKLTKKGNFLIEGHIACEIKLKADVVIVLRTPPKLLEKRLKKRGYSKKKIGTNILAEILDYCTILSLQNYSNVYEVRTDKRIEVIINEIKEILEGKRKDLKAGWVNWSASLLWEKYEKFYLSGD